MRLKMSLIERLKKDLEFDEGMRYTVYDDATGKRIVPGYTLVGHPTIGIGRALDVNGVTAAEAELMLQNDIEEVIHYCTSQLNWFSDLSETRQAVICNMVFQLGYSKFQSFFQFILCCAQGRWKEAHDAGLDSVWAKQTPARAVRLMTTLQYNVVPK